MIWAVLTVILCLIAYLFYPNRTRSKGEPPLDKGLIPWLGHALEFGKDAAKFLARMKKEHGDIFTVRVAGHYVTVLLDPNSYDAVLQDHDSLDFCGQKVVQKVFNVYLPDSTQPDEKQWMNQHFQGQKLNHLSNLMHKSLQGLLRSPDMVQNPDRWKQDGLFSFCYSLLFKAGFLTLFSMDQSDTDLTAVYREFRTFDGQLTKLARLMLNPAEKKAAYLTRERLWDLLSPSRTPAAAASHQWLQDYRQHLTLKGVDKETQRRATLLQLWVTQCNAGPAAFWLLGFLLTHPEAMRAMRTEIDSLKMQSSSAEHLTLDKLHNTPVFDSVLSETLRLSAAVFINREVKKDMTLHMAGGRAYHLRRGDRVCLFPYLCPQMDPCIHPEPETFKYDRFLNTDGSEKTDFFKERTRMKYFTMPWGAGLNTCVGQHFAINTIKQFIFMVLTSLDVELCVENSIMPPPNTSRYGFGVLQPNGDLEVRYRLKT